jgi:hypothetical protein
MPCNIILRCGTNAVVTTTAAHDVLTQTYGLDAVTIRTEIGVADARGRPNVNEGRGVVEAKLNVVAKAHERGRHDRVDVARFRIDQFDSRLGLEKCD